MSKRVARAVDIGFGYTKVAQSMIDDVHGLRALSFPSFPSPVASNTGFATDVMDRLHFVTVDIDGARYNVGPDAMTLASGRAVRTATDLFFSSPQYQALYLGAIAYMDLPKGQSTIHQMSLGLPTTVWANETLRSQLKERMRGTFEVPVPDSAETRRITVEEVSIYPQVLGLLVSISSQDGDMDVVAKQNNLVIDVGFGTLLWMVTKGFKQQMGRTSGTQGGVSSMLKAVARSLGNGLQNDPRTLERIDDALRLDQPLQVDGQTIDLTRCRAQADAQALTHVQELIESIGNTNDLDNIFLGGGGMHLYERILQDTFKGRVIRRPVTEPQFANLNGLQDLAEQRL